MSQFLNSASFMLVLFMKPGNVAFIPKGTVHAFINVGEFTDEVISKIVQKHGEEFVGQPL